MIHPRESDCDEIFRLIMAELAKAEAKHPGWPTDIVHQAAILAEESGETVQACLQFYYENGSIERVRREALQTATVALRLLLNLKESDGRIR